MSTALANDYLDVANNPPAFFPITPDNRRRFKALISSTNRGDLFSQSAAYFGMTGRNGLWVYADGETAMIIARHPNRNGTLLFFPPIGPNPEGIISKALADERLPEGNIELARVSAEDQALATRLGGMCNSAVSSETVLDWAYPVHVISPDKIVARQGKNFVSFRGHINRALRAGYTTESVDFAVHGEALTEAVTCWARDKATSNYTFEDLTTPTLAVIGLASESDLSLQGTLTRDVRGRPVGFWLWENVSGKAISLARCASRRQGVAELGILRTCEQVSANGVSEFYLGGSESASLDAFKRKLQPIRSIVLQTLPLRTEPLKINPKAYQKWFPRVL